MSRRIDLTGKKFGKLTVVEYDKDHKWLCRCDCGRTVYCESHNLRKGYVKTCGQIGCKLSCSGTKSGMKRKHPSDDDIKLTSTVTGVTYKRRDRAFTAEIRKGHGPDAEYVHLGSFSDVRKAIKARKLAEFNLLVDEIAEIIKEHPEYNYNFKKIKSMIDKQELKTEEV